MRETIEKAVGVRDVFWVIGVAVAATIIGAFLLRHIELRYEIYAAAETRAHEAWIQRQLVFQKEHLDLERRYRAREIEWSPAAAESAGLQHLGDEQLVTLEAE